MDPLAVTAILPAARIAMLPAPPSNDPRFAGGGRNRVLAVTALRPAEEMLFPVPEHPPLGLLAGPTVMGPPMLTFPVTRITRPLGTTSEPVGVMVKLENWREPLGGFTLQLTADEIDSAPSEPSP
jgi:hypothetical protein